MTSVSATTYAPSYAAILANAQKQAQSAATPATDDAEAGATTITLSEAAKAKLQVKDFATVIADARATMDKLLTDAGRTSPLANGKLVIDLGKVDRRELFAISSNAGQQFTADEQKAANIELQRRFDAALIGPTAVARITDDLEKLYKAALTYLESMGPEEKASSAYADQKAAIGEALKQIAADPNEYPADIPDDPVADYLRRTASGESGELRDFGDVASDVRLALDQQYAEAKAAGKELVFDSRRKTGQLVDFSDFDSRSISAMALNSGDKFSDSEVRAAKVEIRSRSNAALLAGLKAAGNSGDPTAFAQNIISQYASLSSEEREAAGWSPEFYAAALSNYRSAAKIAEMFGGNTEGSTGGAMSLLNFL